MKEIRKTVVKAPVEEGSVLIPDVLGLGIDVIATKRVERSKDNKWPSPTEMQERAILVESDDLRQKVAFIVKFHIFRRI